MEGQGAQAQKVSNSSLINTPDNNHVIIFRDDSDGIYYAKKPDGTVEPIAGTGGASLVFTEFTINYSDFQPNAGNSGNFKFATLPAGSVVVGAKMKHTIQFAAGSVNIAGMNIYGNDFNGQPTSVSVISDADNLFDALADSKGSYNLQFSAFKILNHDNPADLWANLAVAGGVATIDDLTAGQVKVWLLLMVAR